MSLGMPWYHAWMKRRGLIGQDAPEAAAFAEEADSRLFTAVRSNTGHVLHRLFPPHRSQTRYELRRWGMIISFLLKTIAILFHESFLTISAEYHSLLSHPTYFLNYCCNKLQYCQLDFE